VRARCFGTAHVSVHPAVEVVVFLIFALKTHPSVVTVLSMHRSYEEEANQRLDKEMEDSETRSI